MITLDPRDLAFMAQELKAEIPLFKQQRILLTGGTGFLGRWLQAFLLTLIPPSS